MIAPCHVYSEVNVANSLDFFTLQKRCLKGDDSAWRELYQNVFSRAKAIAQATPFRFDTSTAEDIAQDVVVELTRKLVDVENISGFVGRVAHNKCVDYIRKKKETPFSSLVRENSDSTECAIDVAGPDFLPETLDDNRALLVVRRKLMELGEPCRELIQGRFFDDLSYEEVANRVSLPASQVGVYLARCLGRLRKHLENTQGLWAELEGLLRG